MKICIPGSWTSIGGPSTFYRNLVAGLEKRGHTVTNDLTERPLDVILVIMLTRQLPNLIKAKNEGIRIVQRLDGILWRHRVQPMPVRQKMLFSIRNRIMAFIRRYIANHIIYQSKFVEEWWNNKFGLIQNPSSIIYNGVDLSTFTQFGAKVERASRITALCVEGNLDDAYSIPVHLFHELRDKYDLEVFIYGNFLGRIPEDFINSGLVYVGKVSNSELPKHERGATFLISADINAACPNTVIEAMACGVPIVGFRTGALPELVSEGAGCLADYGGDPWALDLPDIQALCFAAECVIKNQAQYKQNARAQAEKHFDLEMMIDAYVKILNE